MSVQRPQSRGCASTPPGAGTAVLAPRQSPTPQLPPPRTQERVPLLVAEPVWWSASTPHATSTSSSSGSSSGSSNGGSSGSAEDEFGLLRGSSRCAGSASRLGQGDGGAWRVEVRGVDTQIDCSTMQAVGVVYLDVTQYPSSSGTAIAAAGATTTGATTGTEEDGATRWQLSRTFVQCYALDVDLHYRFRRARLPQLPKRQLFKVAADPPRRR